MFPVVVIWVAHGNVCVHLVLEELPAALSEYVISCLSVFEITRFLEPATKSILNHQLIFLYVSVLAANPLNSFP